MVIELIPKFLWNADSQVPLTSILSPGGEEVIKGILYLLSLLGEGVN